MLVTALALLTMPSKPLARVQEEHRLYDGLDYRPELTSSTRSVPPEQVTPEDCGVLSPAWENLRRLAL